MKRVIVTALTLVVYFTWTFADTWDGISVDKSWYESGQIEYHINNAAQLKGLADLVNNDKLTFSDCTLYLESDIDLNNQQWIPIGFGNTAFDGGKFEGIFNGQDYTINNMFIDTSLLPYSQGVLTIGLFGNLGGTLRNLNLNSTIELRSSENIYSSFVFYIGGLAGKGKNINHCICKTDFFFYMSGNSFTYVGFAAGEATTIESVKTDGLTYYSNCYMSGTLGGIVGNGNIVKQCASTGSLIVPSYPETNGSHIGGIAGYATLIEDVIFTGVMRTYDHSYSRNNTFVGGICGGGYDGTITNAIFAPSEYESNVGLYYLGWIAPTYSSFTVSNAFYMAETTSSNEPYGISANRDYLTSGIAIDGFDENIWKFEYGKFPQLISLIPIPKYSLSYIVDGVVYKEYKLKEGDVITPEAEPTKDGYTFSGWSWIPSKMPAEDVTITGSFVANNYILNYIVDGEIYKSYEVACDSPITPETEPEKEGYTFSGWSYIPSKMPAEDVTVTGTFTINKYKLIYIIDDKVYKEVEYEYGATIVPEQKPEDDEYISFEWTGLPDTMPAHDVTVYANYETGVHDVIMPQSIIHIYNFNGTITDIPQKGLNILQMSDGTMKKILIK